MSLTDWILRTMSTDEREAYRARQEYQAKNVAEVRALSDHELGCKLEIVFKNCSPTRWKVGDPVYEATLHHVLIPELIERLKTGCQACLACGRRRHSLEDGECVECRH